MGYGYGGHMFGFMSGFGVVFVLLYVVVVIYALAQLTRIARSLKSIAASLERMGKTPERPNDI